VSATPSLLLIWTLVGKLGGIQTYSRKAVSPSPPSRYMGTRSSARLSGASNYKPNIFQIDVEKEDTVKSMKWQVSRVIRCTSECNITCLLPPPQDFEQTQHSPFLPTRLPW
jgi:hypothetical protein